MATRGAFGFRKNWTTKLIYNHWDSYPEGLGREFVDWIKTKTSEELNKIYDNLKMGRSNEYWIEKFTAGYDQDNITWDEVKKDETADCYIEYTYIYDLDQRKLETEGQDTLELYHLQKEIESYTKTKYARRCDHCGKVFNEGFCINGGEEYYCSNQCLDAEIPEDEQEELDIGWDDSESYWTEWECEEDMEYYADWTEIPEEEKEAAYERRQNKVLTNS